MIHRSMGFLRKLAKPSLCSSWGLACVVFLSGCDSTFYQLFSEGSQLVDAIRPGKACSPQLLSLRLGVKAGPEGGMPEQAVVDEAIAELQRRLGSFGLSEFQVSQWGEDSIEVFIDGALRPETLVKLLTLDAQMEMRSQRIGTEEETHQTRFAVDALQLELRQAEAAGALGNPQELAEQREQFEQAQAELRAFFKEAQLTTQDIAKAYPSMDAVSGGQWSVYLEFTPEAAEEFAEQTRNLAGTGRSLGIFVNGELISAPVVDVTFAEEGITGGTVVISGNFTAEEAKTLAVQLSSGSLPTPLELLEQQLIDNPDCSR